MFKFILLPLYRKLSISLGFYLKCFWWGTSTSHCHIHSAFMGKITPINAAVNFSTLLLHLSCNDRIGLAKNDVIIRKSIRKMDSEKRDTPWWQFSQPFKIGEVFAVWQRIWKKNKVGLLPKKAAWMDRVPYFSHFTKTLFFSKCKYGNFYHSKTHCHHFYHSLY